MDVCSGDDAQASSLRLPWASQPSFWHLLCTKYRLSEFLRRIKILILHPGCSFQVAWEDHGQQCGGLQMGVMESGMGLLLVGVWE